MDKFDLRLIPKFDSSPMGLSVIKWFEKAKQVCKLFRIKEPSMVIPLRLTKGAYVIYQQLGDDVNLEEIKRALYTAFETDSFIAWKQFVGQQLNLRRFVVPFGRATDGILEYTFLAGLLDDVSQLLQASLRWDELGIDKLLARVQTSSERQHTAGDSAVPRPRISPKCYRYGDLNHYSRDCWSQGNTGGANDQKTKEWLHSHQCNGLGHIERNCSRNRSGDKMLWLALPPPNQWMWHYP